MADPAGKFIVLEGVDGSGKSTQAYLLSKYLAEQKVRVLPTREPGGTTLGERIREILLEPGQDLISAQCELLLYMASRAQHVSEVIKPSLEKGYIVVCERYLLSSIAYQGYAGGLSKEDIRKIGEFAVMGTLPDLTIILDVEPSVATAREKLPAGAGYDRIEKKGIQFQERVRAGFLELAKTDPEKIKVVDASRPAKAVHTEIRKLLAGVIG